VCVACLCSVEGVCECALDGLFDLLCLVHRDTTTLWAYTHGHNTPHRLHTATTSTHSTPSFVSLCTLNLFLGVPTTTFTNLWAAPFAASRYWAALTRHERALTHAPVTTPPSFDFTEFVCEDLSVEAGPASLQLAPRADIEALLVDKHWDAAQVVDVLLP
jgi:hypothetical protein